MTISARCRKVQRAKLVTARTQGTLTRCRVLCRCRFAVAVVAASFEAADASWRRGQQKNGSRPDATDLTSKGDEKEQQPQYRHQDDDVLRVRLSCRRRWHFPSQIYPNHLQYQLFFVDMPSLGFETVNKHCCHHIRRRQFWQLTPRQLAPAARTARRLTVVSVKGQQRRQPSSVASVRCQHD